MRSCCCGYNRCIGVFKAAPYWLDEPQNLILAPGEDGRLVCRANGNPKPAIQWLVNGEPIEGEQGESVPPSQGSDHESQAPAELRAWAPASQHIKHLPV